MEMIRRKRGQAVVLDEVGLIVNPLEDFKFFGGGGSKSRGLTGGAGIGMDALAKGLGIKASINDIGRSQVTVVKQAPTPNTSEEAPNPTEEETATELDEDKANKKQIVKLGSKSLVIPISTQNTKG